MKKITLIQLNEKTKAIVREVEGGHNIEHKLEALGIRPGVEIEKITSHFWRGPVTVMVGQAKVAIGHGMAEKIHVEVE
jgi:ferrous iron transport protein A